MKEEEDEGEGLRRRGGRRREEDGGRSKGKRFSYCKVRRKESSDYRKKEGIDTASYHIRYDRYVNRERSNLKLVSFFIALSHLDLLRGVIYSYERERRISHGMVMDRIHISLEREREREKSRGVDSW